MAPSGGGRGRRGGGAGRRTGGGGDEGGDASPEWLPPQQRRELLETTRATRSSTAGRGREPTQEFLDRLEPEVRQAGGLDEREPIAVVLHRQGQLWAPGPNMGVQPPVPAQPGVEDVGVREVQHSTCIPTHKWCPKAARGEFARELGSLWRRLCENPDDVRLWCLEAMFASAILPAGRGPREADAYSQLEW